VVGVINPAEYERLDRHSRLQLRMYEITPRERRLCEVILDYSFARGRDVAIVPDLAAFCDLTGLDKGDVSRALQLLLARGIVQRRGPRDAREYAFIPSAAFWCEKKPLFDVGRAVERAAQLERMNTQRKLPVEEADYDDGVAMAARDDALAQVPVIGESPTVTIGKTPISAAIGESPTKSIARDACTRAGDVKNNVVQNVNVKRPQFADGEAEHVWEQLEQFADAPDFRQYRPKWLQRVARDPHLVAEGLGDAKAYAAANKVHTSRAALVFRRCQQLAKSLGRSFHLL
jgi:hypothetical protein